jgi:lipid A disaccharide synthetase
MLEVATAIRAEFPQTSFLVPTVAATHPVVEADVRAWAAAAGKIVTPSDGGGEVRLGDAGAALRYARDAFDDMVPRCDVCVTASGTATLHVAGYGVPMAVVYASSWLVWNGVGRWLLRIRTFALVNLLADPDPTRPDVSRHIVPEFMPWYGPTKPVADRVIGYLREPEKLRVMRNALNRLIGTLDRPGASDNVARIALGMVKQRPKDPGH